jgi:hypothetical protein
MRILACGHGHYDKGHCAMPGCPNDFRVCPDCNWETSWPKWDEADR